MRKFEKKKFQKYTIYTLDSYKYHNILEKKIKSGNKQNS